MRGDAGYDGDGGSMHKGVNDGGQRLRALLAQPGIARLLGAHDALTALAVERAGLEAVFLGGFGVSASMLGLPDLNFLGISEMAEATRRVAQRVSLPIRADADTGHGGLHNVAHCVRELRQAGAAGMILEDQEFPKRCGHFAGKRVIPGAEMARKIQVAAAARGGSDFVLVGRTDAREPHGLEEAIRRANLYCEAGADVAFVEAPLSEEELCAVCRQVPHPKLVNMLAFGKTPRLSAAALAEMGFDMVVAPIDSVLLLARAMGRLAAAFRRDGHTGALAGEMTDFAGIKELLGLREFLDLQEDGDKPAD